MITAGGVFLGIAFLASTFTQSTIASHTQIIVEGLDAAQRQALHDSEAARQVWLVSLSLVVVTVGIANSMLMSVTERFKEIGTMKCLGALDGFIVKLFMLEAGLLGIVASAMGWFVGFSGVVLVGFLREGYKLWPKLPPGEIVTTFLWCMLIGEILTLLATIFPAIRASRLPPAAALRVEI
jgi:ABC-type antimicrobial peptide transport system permease subunit